MLQEAPKWQYMQADANDQNCQAVNAFKSRRIQNLLPDLSHAKRKYAVLSDAFGALIGSIVLQKQNEKW